jgi:hypothetical protein
MNKLSFKVMILPLIFLSSFSNAWEATVTNILQHGSYAAIDLSPDPGVGNCEYGSPYLLVVDGTPESNQRFSMLLTALVSGKKVAGYADECAAAIWGKSRPTIRRLNLRAN